VARIKSIRDTSRALAVLDHLQRCGTVQQADDLQDALQQAWRVSCAARSLRTPPFLPINVSLAGGS
jgi:hypothetical protein